MTPSSHVIDVSESDFEYEVINYSQNIPVVVDFWANWCVPCKTLGPILSRLAEEGKGSFRLAKVDIDANPNLAIKYGVRSIPYVKAFLNGQVTSEFTGLIPEARIREFIGSLVPDEISLAVEKAEGLLTMQRWTESEQIFRDILDENPGQPSARIGLIKSLIGQGYGREALALEHDFPASREYATAELLLPLIKAMVAFEKGELSSETPLDAAFQNALRLISRGNIYAALDGLLDVLRQDKRYRDDTGRQVYLGLLEILGEDNPQTRQYRSDLTSILF